MESYSEKCDNPPARDVAKDPMPRINVVYHAHHENEAPQNKGIKSPSKLLSLKYQSQSSIREQNRRSSSLKRVYFINTVTIIRKEDEPREADAIETDATKDDDGNTVVEVEKKNMWKIKEIEESEEGVEEELKEEEEDDKYFDTFPIIKELRRVKGLKVFMGTFTYECYFVVLGDTTSVIDHYLGSMVLGKPFVEAYGLIYDKVSGDEALSDEKKLLSS
ncbi:hypothetical protein Tco_1115633 [Tanacetum coccineum]